MPSCIVTVEPAIEPISLATAKLHCKIDDGDDDALVSALITTARRWCEARLGQQLITATRKLFLDELCGREITLPYSPLQSVTSVQYVDSGGTTQTWSSSLYDVDANDKPGRIRPAWGQVWPAFRYQMNAITVTYVCGYGTAETDVPAPIRQAMLLLIGHWYENREAVTIGNALSFQDIPLTVESLLMSEWHGSIVFAGGDDE